MQTLGLIFIQEYNYQNQNNYCNKYSTLSLCVTVFKNVTYKINVPVNTEILRGAAWLNTIL